MSRVVFAALVLLGGCVSRPVVSVPPAACASLVPAGWQEGVEAAPVPNDAPVTLGAPLTPAMVAAIIAPWASGYVLMSAAVEKSNGRQKDTVSIIINCEKLLNDARP